MASDEHFNFDGTLIEAWASHKSLRRKDGTDDDNLDGPERNAGRNFHDETRSNDTHASMTYPDARMYRKGNGVPARLCFVAHVLMDNRNRLVVDAIVTEATAPRDDSWLCWYDGRLPALHERLGGTGRPLHEFLALVPRFAFGLPIDWSVGRVARASIRGLGFSLAPYVTTLEAGPIALFKERRNLVAMSTTPASDLS